MGLGLEYCRSLLGIAYISHFASRPWRGTTGGGNARIETMIIIARMGADCIRQMARIFHSFSEYYALFLRRFVLLGGGWPESILVLANTL